MENILNTEIQLVTILLIVSAVAILVRYIKLPYTVALVVAGLFLALRGQSLLALTPNLVLGLFVPPLVFEAAFHLHLNALRRDLTAILLLAAPGVALSTVIVGAILAFTGVLTWPLALLFGALISATDPVAVVALFRALGAPNRLTTLVESESLFNDGTAIVIFRIVLVWALGGTLSPLQGAINFVVVSAGGLVIGVVLGLAVARVIARIDDYLIEITLTTILAYGSYLLAEQLHVSGVLAVVAAGLFSREVGSKGMSPTTRIVLTNFWEYIAFLANSFIFLLIGMNVQFNEPVGFIKPALIAIVGVLVARAITVYFLGGLMRLFKVNLSFPYLSVMGWAGLRGAVSLALALSLPLTLTQQGQLQAMTFAVVLFTLLVQATTIRGLLKRLGLTRRTDITMQYERLQGELLAVRAASRHLDRLYYEGALIPSVRETLKAELEQREQGVNQALKALLAEQPDLNAQIIAHTRRDVLRAGRAALAELAHDGLLEEDILIELQVKLDERLQESDDGDQAPPISTIDAS